MFMKDVIVLHFNSVACQIVSVLSENSLWLPSNGDVYSYFASHIACWHVVNLSFSMRRFHLNWTLVKTVLVDSWLYWEKIQIWWFFTALQCLCKCVVVCMWAHLEIKCLSVTWEIICIVYVLYLSSCALTGRGYFKLLLVGAECSLQIQRSVWASDYWTTALIH